MTHVLHINDNNLCLSLARDTIISQGYAWLSGDGVSFDLNTEAPAVKRCRLSPQEINNRYWQQCDQSAIPTNTAGMRHSADLIWQHLSQLKQQHNIQDVTLVVPSHYREENLQLLLGIAKACDLKVTGLLNKAVLGLSNQLVEPGEYLHFDLQLHQTVCSSVNVASGLVKLGEVEVLQDVGIHLMQESLLKGLQNSFIQNDRFDPLHDASTEQQLFDQLGNIATQLSNSGKANIGVEHQGRLHNTSIDSKEWSSLLQAFTDRLIQVGSSKGELAHAYIDLNSAFDEAQLESLNHAGINNLSSAPDVPGSILNAQNSADDTLIYRTDLALRRAPQAINPAATETAKGSDALTSNVLNGAPTHLLSAGTAVAISQAEVLTANNTLSVQQSAKPNALSLLRSGQLFVMNDQGRTSLKANDRLGSQLADGVITVIQVL